jgi:hypothetical protein
VVDSLRMIRVKRLEQRKRAFEQWDAVLRGRRKERARGWRNFHRITLKGGSLVKDKRFIKTYSQGSVNAMEVWVDSETGINYLFHQSGYAGGMTVLLDKEGKPVVTRLSPAERDRL